MVHLNRIYTGAGDDGQTRLGDGQSLPKHAPRVAAYGEVDELAAVLGVARLQALPSGIADEVLRVQNDLGDLGADLCVPGSAGPGLRLTADQVARLEASIDAVNAGLEPLNSFVLPGGSAGAAWLHLARTVCRRAERAVSLLVAEDGELVNGEVLRYLNRLSDLLFVWARQANDGGRGDVLWQPGDRGAE
ncbi:MAG: cob(I)yrinic acid a,c-diamide adenosyltransferase [Planctomycetota bacterium]|jgi:cob(I)alamin adenosyltransferase|nr:ATP:cob(I)alamin adenosyltransferase [Planctomycetota bacterium]MDP6370754.1 cob(I)yrinic acid a,c-diamide adenosyltransferase [Planctomycetota bacterium]